MFDGDELGFLVGWLDGDAEGLDDGSFEAITVGLNDGADDFSTHSRLPTKSSSFRDQQHIAMSQLLVFLEFMKHSEMKSVQTAL